PTRRPTGPRARSVLRAARCCLASGRTAGGQPATARDQDAAPGDPEVPLITTARVDIREADLAGRERDSLVLTAEGRRWGRRSVTTTGGRALALALPPGSPP